jgi:glycosyltransferase involved in cell wall biosynthesis
MTTPRVSVVIRSYNRLPALCALIEILLAQRHDSFEIVVVEQSTELPEEPATRLAELERDPRLRVLRGPPLGGARARNRGIQHMRGEIAVFVDDDDLPVGHDFLALIEAPFREDPNCLAVTCRHLWSDPDRISRVYRWLAPSHCLRFSTVLGLPDNFVRYDQRLDGRDYVHGTGGAYRRSVFERFGGWDDDTPIEDETSLGIRMRRGISADEYIAFDPRAELRRGFDLDGGLGKRRNTPGRYYGRFMTFVHKVLGRYYPVRVRLLYPLYVIGAWRFTIGWMWDDSIAHDTLAKRVLGTALFTLALPYHAIKALRVRLGRLPGSGLAMRELVGKGG